MRAVGHGSERPSQKGWVGGVSVQGTWVDRHQQPCLTSIQQLVLHAVALQDLLTLGLLPAHFQRRGSQG